MAVNDDDAIIRFVTWKRNPQKLVRDLLAFDEHIGRFLAHHKRYNHYTIERAAIAPEIHPEVARAIGDHGYIAEDLRQLTKGL